MLRRSKVLIGIFCLAVVSAGLSLNYLRQHYVVPIIMYHSVSPQANKETMLAITPQTFERQMYFLKKHRYHVVPLESLVALIRQKEKIPPKTVAITFDDGYKDNFLYAFPVLKKYNLPATIFIIVNEVGRAENDRLSWDEIKAMQDAGVISFGSHCLGPEPLVNIKSQELLKQEIFDSKKILEERLGRKVAFFSYPEGLFNAKIRQLVIAAGYRGAVATNPGKNYPDNDIYALKRLRISENAANMFVFAVEVSGFYTFMKESKRHAKK